MNPTATTATKLPHLSTIVLSGADVRAFLQGQLSADLDSLDARRALLASCNSAQGRVQGVLWIVVRNEGVAMLLPAAMADTIAARLRKYVLRSKVKIEAGQFSVATLAPDALPAAVSLAQPRAHCEHDAVSYISLPGHEAAVVITPQDVAEPDSAADARWRLQDIRAGLPQVYPQTHEAFVAQMLNLDLLGGISFEKGCYTGQEIIARTHYRGAIKRRMFRFAAPCLPPAPGTRVLSGEQHAGEVVDAAPAGQGCELLAVISTAQLGQTLQLENVSGAKLEQLSLPYEI